MKTPFGIRRLLFFALLLAASVIVVSCVTANIPGPIVNGSPRIIFYPKGGVLVPRAIALSPHDLARLNHVLAKYDESLYQVRFYEHGKVVREKGMAKCVSPQGVAIVDNAAEKSGASNVAIQGSIKPYGGGGPTCSNASNFSREAEQLSEKVTAILKKYSNR